MKRQVIAFSCVLAINALASFPLAAQEQSKDFDARKFLDDASKAFNKLTDTKDVNSVTRFYAPDAVFIDSINGVTSLGDMKRRFHAELKKSIELGNPFKIIVKYSGLKVRKFKDVCILIYGSSTIYGAMGKEVGSMKAITTAVVSTEKTPVIVSSHSTVVELTGIADPQNEGLELPEDDEDEDEDEDEEYDDDE